MFDEPLLERLPFGQHRGAAFANGHRLVGRVAVEFRSSAACWLNSPRLDQDRSAQPRCRDDEYSILSDWDFSIWRPRIIAIEIQGPLAVTELAKNPSATLLVERDYVFLSRLWHTSIFLDRSSIRPEFLW